MHRFTQTIPCLMIICACATLTSSFEQPSWRNMEKLRRGNCTKCKASLAMNVQEVLPRLTLIKQRILNAIGRNPAPRNDLANEIEAVDKRHSPDISERPLTQKPQRRIGYRHSEIISYSKPVHQYHDDDVLKFSYQGNKQSGKEEALGASLLLYVYRRRNSRKGGKGKKILLEISKLNKYNSTWETLSVLQTRVKKRRWKRISLPVKAAQQLLDSENRSLDLKVSCIGCGRLVNLVLDKYSIKDLTKSFRQKTDVLTDSRHRISQNSKKHRNKSRRLREKRLKRRQKHSGTPMLVISTRVQL